MLSTHCSQQAIAIIIRRDCGFNGQEAFRAASSSTEGTRNNMSGKATIQPLTQPLGFASLPVGEVLGALVRGAEVLPKHLRK